MVGIDRGGRCGSYVPLMMENRGVCKYYETAAWKFSCLRFHRACLGDQIDSVLGKFTPFLAGLIGCPLATFQLREVKISVMYTFGIHFHCLAEYPSPT